VPDVRRRVLGERVSGVEYGYNFFVYTMKTGSMAIPATESESSSRLSD
jgi:hypothetical protein